MIIVRRTLCGCECQNKIPDEWHDRGYVIVPISPPDPGFTNAITNPDRIIGRVERKFIYRGTVNDLGMPMYYEEALKK
jgi:hypothetical protein